MLTIELINTNSSFNRFDVCPRGGDSFSSGSCIPTLEILKTAH